MAIVTNSGHVNNAIRLTDEIGKLYIAIGGTEEWTNPSIPPAEQEMQTTIPSLIGMKKADTVSLARLVSESEEAPANAIKYGGNTYELVSRNDAYTKNALYVYVKATISPEDLPVGKYRVVGLLENPTFNTGVTGDAIPANQVKSQGVLSMYENRVAVDRTNLKINEQLIIKA